MILPSPTLLPRPTLLPGMAVGEPRLPAGTVDATDRAATLDAAARSSTVDATTGTRGPIE